MLSDVGEARRLGLSLEPDSAAVLPTLESSAWLEGEQDLEDLVVPTVLGFAIFWPSATDCVLPMITQLQQLSTKAQGGVLSFTNPPSSIGTLNHPCELLASRMIQHKL
jgi:hypothetical protein